MVFLIILIINILYDILYQLQWNDVTLTDFIGTEYQDDLWSSMIVLLLV